MAVSLDRHDVLHRRPKSRPSFCWRRECAQISDVAASRGGNRKRALSKGTHPVGSDPYFQILCRPISRIYIGMSDPAPGEMMCTSPANVQCFSPKLPAWAISPRRTDIRLVDGSSRGLVALVLELRTTDQRPMPCEQAFKKDC